MSRNSVWLLNKVKAMAKCLFADDSKIIRMLFVKIMGNLGFEVIDAEDG